MKIAALIPVKTLANAKQRLEPIFSPAERILLAETMLREVLAAVVAAPSLQATFVVTSDPKVAEISAAFGAKVIHEEKELGETQAVTFALDVLAGQGYGAVLVVPADIPLLRAEEVELLLKASPKASPFVLLVPSHDRRGTNALVLSPPGVIGLGFGADSFSYHLKQAAAQGVTPRVVENARIALDLDEPKDIEAFLKSAPQGQNDKLLLRLNKEGAPAPRP